MFLFLSIQFHTSLLLLNRRPSRSALFPYTTLFRSGERRRIREEELAERRRRAREEAAAERARQRSEEHTSELQSRGHLVCRPLLEKKINISQVHKQITG